MGSPFLGNEPMKNGRMLCFVRWVCLNMMCPNGCSSPCPMHKISPLHLGVLPSNRRLGMPFPRYVPCPLSAHLQLYSTPLTPSCLLLLRSIKCCRQFSAPVLFWCRSIFANHRVGGGTVRLCRIFLVLASMGNVVLVT